MTPTTEYRYLQFFTPADFERFWSKVDKTPGFGPKGECWRWTDVPSAQGYGLISVGGRNGKRFTAHSVSCELAHGPTPPKYETDHLCRNRICVNPDHLEAVTLRINGLRGVGRGAINSKVTHCPAGHAYDAENTAIAKRGSRVCKTCKREWDRAYKLRTRHPTTTEQVASGMAIDMVMEALKC